MPERGGGHGGEVLCHIVKRARERLREGRGGQTETCFNPFLHTVNQRPQKCSVDLLSFSYLEFESEGGGLGAGEVLHI